MSGVMNIPFNIPFTSGQELSYIEETFSRRKFSGAGPAGSKCEHLIEECYPGSRCLLTTSCTHAIELIALLLNISEGDEVIMPSFTFVSTANPFVLRGAKIKFVDVDFPSLNISAEKVSGAITPKTKAVVAVNYGGGGGNWDSLRSLCDANGIFLVEDAAQSIGSHFNNKPYGSFGVLSALSFHETKNIHCGEGGALIINDQQYLERAEMLREKGTNRAKFFRGQVDKYTWVDIGSSYVQSDILASFLQAQLESVVAANTPRLRFWKMYAEYCIKSGLPYLKFDDGVDANGHIFGIFVESLNERTALMSHLKSLGIHTTYHYVPLHSTEIGRKHGEFVGEDKNTKIASDRLIRLPMFSALNEESVDYVTSSIASFYK